MRRCVDAVPCGTVFILDVARTTPPTFRWSDDLGGTWKAEKVPITHQWQPLGEGVEVRFARRQWEKGHTVTFTVRSLLVSVIEKIQGNSFTLRDAPSRAVQDARVRHCDHEAIQAAVDRALKEKRNVFFPPLFTTT